MAEPPNFFEALIEREEDEIRALVPRLGVQDALAAVTRFGLLSFTPSAHGRGALLALRALNDLHERGEATLELICEGALYVSATRPPWSEPPIGDPPSISTDQSAEADEIIAACEARDRLSGERWLAAAMRTPDFARRYFEAALAIPDETLQPLVVAVAAWGFASAIPSQHRYVVLRAAMLEWTRQREHVGGGSVTTTVDAAIEGAIRRYVLDPGPLSFELVAAASAAAELQALGFADIAERAASRLKATADEDSETQEMRPSGDGPTPELRAYPLARDYADLLQAHAFVRRHAVSPTLSVPLLRAADEAMSKESFADWTHA